VRVLGRIVPVEEGPAGPRRTIRKEGQSQAHVKWECKYHGGMVPNYRQKAILGKLRPQLGAMLRPLCRPKEIELLEGHAMVDQVPMRLSVPPRYRLAMTIGYLQGKRAVRIHRDYGKARESRLGRSFWSRGYGVSPVGFDEASVRQYIQEQEEREKQEEQGGLMFD
jgi:putative transposase